MARRGRRKAKDAARIKDRGFKALGFLSPHIANAMAAIRRKHGKWFEVSQALSELAVKTLFDMKPRRTSDQDLLTSVLFGRALAAQQTVIIQRSAC